MRTSTSIHKCIDIITAAEKNNFFGDIIKYDILNKVIKRTLHTQQQRQQGKQQPNQEQQDRQQQQPIQPRTHIKRPTMPIISCTNKRPRQPSPNNNSNRNLAHQRRRGHSRADRPSLKARSATTR